MALYGHSPAVHSAFMKPGSLSGEVTTLSNHVIPFLPVLGKLQVFITLPFLHFTSISLGWFFYIYILEDLGVLISLYIAFFVTIFDLLMPF